MPIYKIYTEATIRTGISRYKFHIADDPNLNHSARVKIINGDENVGTVPALPNHELDFDDTYNHDKCNIDKSVPDEVANLAVCFAVYADEEINNYKNSNKTEKDIRLLQQELDKCKKEFGGKITKSKARKIANNKRENDIEGY